MSSEPAPARSTGRLFLLIPLVAFMGLAGLFLAQLLSGRDISEIPSALVGQPAPKTLLPPLEGSGLPGLDSASFPGGVTLVNVWASWCAPCREEHPMLLALAQDKRFRLVGMNYKDSAENARRFLGDLGNPFAAIGIDEAGRSAIDWGVYGVPETYVIGRDGRVLYRHVGPLTPDSLAKVLMPEVEKALAAPAGATSGNSGAGS